MGLPCLTHSEIAKENRQNLTEWTNFVCTCTFYFSTQLLDVFALCVCTQMALSKHISPRWLLVNLCFGLFCLLSSPSTRMLVWCDDHGVPPSDGTITLSPIIYHGHWVHTVCPGSPGLQVTCGNACSPSALLSLSRQGRSHCTASSCLLPLSFSHLSTVVFAFSQM